MPITDFFIKDVRCFADENNFRIRPLTFLVGENSTGKSTTLACMQAMGNFMSAGKEFNFNNPPYNLGTFSNIVRKSRPVNKSFKLGFTHTLGSNISYNYAFEFKEKDAGTEPVVSYQEANLGKVKIVIKGTKNMKELYGPFLDISKRAGNGKTTFTLKVHEHFLSTYDALYFSTHAASFGMISKVENNDKSKAKLFAELKKIIDFHEPYLLLRRERIEWRTLSIPPIRSEPKRTYDPVAEDIGSVDSDIPTMLMNMSRNYEEVWEELREELISYGKDSGLFSDINVRSFTKLASDPFQIKVKTASGTANLIDVGYGVSQALPIIVNILRSRKNNLLIQQPEIHLHPRGQAELTSLLIQQLQLKKNSLYIIETHSDYMVDRMRIEIRKGNIAPDDVSLIYFEKGSRGMNAHNITFDKEGEMSNVPKNFRQFFVRETHRFLGFDD